jgi:DNA (cytosine-5)-methyltransferase 1
MDKLIELKENQIRFIDLFAGIGGLRLGFEYPYYQSPNTKGPKLGTCVFSSEWDKYARITYEANFGEKPFGDITLLNPTAIPKFDVLLAGFPCQPFSSVGKREGFSHPTQGTLVHEVVKVLEKKRPKAFLLENVKGLLTHDAGKTMKVIESSLVDLGYSFDYRVLDAANFGVPQVRKRVYIVGLRNLQRVKASRIELNWPIGTQNLTALGPFIEKDVTGYSISKHLQKSYLEKIDDGRPHIVDCETEAPAKTLVASYHKIQRLTGTFVKDGETGLRLLTVNECKSIMGFPIDFEIPVSRTQMYRQLGNSVAVPVAREIAKMIYNLIQNKKSVKRI